MPSGRQQTPRLRLWLALLLTLAVSGVAAWRLTLSYDLGAFLPPPDTQAQWLLTQRLGQGPGAQLLFIRLSNSSAAEALQLADHIRDHPQVKRVLPEPTVLSPAAIPEPLWQHRLLLGDLPSDVAGWHAVLAQRTDDLMFAADDEMLQLIAADPALLSVDALTALTAGADQPAFHRGRTQYLMVETQAAGFELAAQTALINDLRGQLAAFEDAVLLGSPVYAVDLQRAVRLEATLFSSLAGLALLMLMIARFRSLHRVIGVALPLAAAGACGLLALTLAFDAVHGITVAFGFTLLGVAIDYPLHLYTHQEHSARQSIWPVLRLGIASTLIAYGTFIFSGTPGLQQLGLFAFVGITAAALIAAWITAEQHHNEASGADDPTEQRLRWWPGLSALAIAGVVLSSTPVFNDNLSSLTPVDPELLAADALVRSELGVSDIRYVVSIRASNEQQTLQATETAVQRLQPLIANGGLDGVQAVTHILPSRQTQAQRRAALGSTLVDHFDAALAQLPLAAEAFEPFRAALAAEQASDTFLTREILVMHGALNATVSTLFFNDGAQWVSLMFLRGLTAPEGVASALAGMSDAELVDLKQTAETLVRDYRTNLSVLLALALMLIALLLATRLSFKQAAWLLLNVTAAVGIAAACSSWWQAGLSLFDIMALTLVAGLGLDYALFYGRARSGADNTATAKAVFLCAVSSLIVFGILALSSIPVLRGIGTTVFIGVITAFALARLGRQANTAV